MAKGTLNKTQEITFDIIERYGEISRNEKGNIRKEFNLVSWNNNEAKLDLRSWIYNAEDEIERCQKGITITLEDFEAMVKLSIENGVIDIDEILANIEPSDDESDDEDDDEEYEEEDDDEEEYEEDDE